MKVLLCGASGFIGRALDEALSRAGYAVLRAARHVPHGEQSRTPHCDSMVHTCVTFSLPPTTMLQRYTGHAPCCGYSGEVDKEKLREK